MNKETFQWTDELVLEYAVRRGLTIADFKQSKPPKPEWEILAFSNGKIVYNKFPDGSFRCDPAKDSHSRRESEFVDTLNGYSISSVKRMSDEEVFTVGDSIDVFYGPQNKKLNVENKITGFGIKSGMIVSHTAGDSPLKDIQKIQTPKPEQRERVKISFDKGSADGGYKAWYNMFCTEIISKEKMSAIKEAIERVLNDDVDVKQSESNGWKCFRDDEFEKQIEKAFNAGRELRPLADQLFVYPDYQHYTANLQSKK